MSKEIRIQGIQQYGNIYIKLDDLVKVLYSDHSELDDDEIEIKGYIKRSINEWGKIGKKIINE